MDNLDAKVREPAVAQVLEDIKERMQCLIFEEQSGFCEVIENLEGFKTFSKSEWKTEEGFGVTQILENDDGMFEKVGVCASISQGILPLSTFLLLNERNPSIPSLYLPQKPIYFTAGLSGVVYPKNPHIPALNFSYRYFEMNDGQDTFWWFGGGTDLIPYILEANDCQHFHGVLKTCCDKYDKTYYRTFKKKCDEHFFLKHRGERRGIGGIFFEKLNFPNQEVCFQFVAECMKNIIQSYIPIVRRNREKSFQYDDKQWQLLLRARSVEFSLICDKATELILRIPGVQHENILISLPPTVRWEYDNSPEETSKEYELLKVLRNPKEWM